MVVHMEVDMEILRDIHWERILLGQKQELMLLLLLVFQL